MTIVEALALFTSLVSGGFSLITLGIDFLLANPLLLIPTCLGIACTIMYAVKGAVR